MKMEDVKVNIHIYSIPVRHLSSKVHYGRHSIDDIQATQEIQP